MDSDVSLYGGDVTINYREKFGRKSHVYLKDEEVLPGVTNTISKVVSKYGLIDWAAACAKEFLLEALSRGVVIDEQIAHEASKHYITKRNFGASTGTIAHDFVERILKGDSIDLSEQPEEVVQAVKAFTGWMKEAKPEVVDVERIIYSMSLGYAGKFDSILSFNGKTYLCDLKTTNAAREAPEGVYAENFIQLGAYFNAYNEERAYELEKTGKSSLVEIDDVCIISARKDGGLSVKSASDIGLTPDDCKQLWLDAFSLASRLDDIKTKLGGK